MKLIGIIPARYQSTRFPGKPLVDILGKTMIRRVYEQACKATLLDKVIVATDDPRIHEEVTRFGGNVMITATHHRNGTERCLEVAKTINADFIINIQGDEPFIQPQQIYQLCRILDSGTQLATLIKKIETKADLENPNIVKVVTSVDNHALYFSRSPIPYDRDNLNTPSLENTHGYWKHIGVYAYQKEVLSEIVSLKESTLEKTELLEQLRWLENGYRIKTSSTDFESIGVDTPEDLETLIQKMRNAI